MLLIILTFFGIFIFEGLGLMRKNEWKNFFIFSLFWLLAFSFAMLQQMEMPIPNPTDFITKVTSTVYKFLTSLYKS